MLYRAYFCGLYSINLAQLKEEHRVATKPKVLKCVFGYEDLHITSMCL